MRTFALAFSDLVILIIVLLGDNKVSVDGHLSKKPPVEQTDPDGKCEIASNKPPGTQVGNMILHPCRQNKLTLRCPSFLLARNSSSCNLKKKKGTGERPFNITVTDMYDELLITLHRHEGVNFMQFFLEAREWRIARSGRDIEEWQRGMGDNWRNAIGKERLGRFFDRINDGYSVYKNGDRQCHEDVCCTFKDVPDVATRCQRPHEGPYEFVGGLYNGNIDQFSWQIPEGFYGDIVFVGTFITSVKEYWPDVLSEIVTIAKPIRVNPRQRYDLDFEKEYFE